MTTFDQYRQAEKAAAASYAAQMLDELNSAENWSLKLIGKQAVVVVHGWNGRRWQRARHDEEDGFDAAGLVRSCSVSDAGDRAACLGLSESTEEAPGHATGPSLAAPKALVAADAHVTRRLLEPVVPGRNIHAGVAAGREFPSAGRV